MMHNPQTPPVAAVEKRHRSLLIVWAAMLTSLGLYVALAIVLAPSGENDDGATANDVVGLALLGVGAACVLASFIIKQRLLSRAVGEQRPELASTAYIVSFALSEAAGVLGLASAFVAGGGFFYILFVISAVGLLLHFPRRDDLAAAAYEEGRTTITGS